MAWIVFVEAFAPKILLYHDYLLPKVVLKVCGLYNPQSGKATVGAVVYTLWIVLTLGGVMLAIPMFKRLSRI